MHYTEVPADCQALTPEGVLHDRDARGNDKPWVTHKREAQVLSLVYHVLQSPKAARVADCAETLSFKVEAETGKLKLASSRFCRVRLCPVCQWRRSMKLFGQVYEITKAIAADEPMAYIMLTLTQKNVSGADLKQDLTRIHKSWDKLTHRKDFKRVVKGYVRSTEITINGERDDFHHHIHAVLAVKPSYFKSRYYIPQATWARIWGECLGVSYTPVVDVRRTYGTAEKAVAEVCKYAAKPTQYTDPSDLDKAAHYVGILDKALERRRFVGWGGIMAEYHKKLGLDDAEDGDLIHITDEIDGIVDTTLLHFDWYSGLRLYYNRAYM